MNIIDRGRAFLDGLGGLARRSGWEWRRCPHCGETETWRHGTYARHPWTLAGRQTVRVQRHWCRRCRRSYSEHSAWLVRGSWYAREVQRFGVDHWQHVGSSLRRTAELIRSLIGRQERWQRWRPLDRVPPDADQCHLSASTLQRWLDRAGRRAQASVPDQLVGIPTSGQFGTDGLWAKLRGGATRVVLLLTDSVTGVVFPPVVATGEGQAADWAPLLAQATAAGLDRDRVRGITSDGAVGFAAFLDRDWTWVNHARCHFHLWRNLSGAFAEAATTAATGLVGAAATAVRRATRRTLAGLVRAVLDARDETAALAALAILAAHPLGRALATALGGVLDAALVPTLAYHDGLVRVGPEWCWRDFRLRLSRGRNHRTDDRLARAALVWAIYRNFEPAQGRSERKRRYRRPGQSPLALAGVPPGDVSYLDALAV
jgi:transposase-like protein